MSIQHLLVDNPPSPFEAFFKDLTVEQDVFLDNIQPVENPGSTVILGVDTANGGKLGSVTVAPGSGLNSLTPVANPGSPNAEAATILGSSLRLEPANATFPGIVSVHDQQFTGNKQVFGNLSANNLAGTNTGDITFAAVGVSPNASGASLIGQEITLQPADGTRPGVVTAGNQTFGGQKTFTTAIVSPNLSGLNTGDVTLTTVGTSPNANGASLVGQQLQLQPASSTFPGVVNNSTQSFSGDKTIVGTIAASNLSGTNTGNVTFGPVGSTPNVNAGLINSTTQVLNLQPADGTNPGVLTAVAQTIGGNKTFTSAITASNLSGTNTGDVTLAAVGAAPNANGATLAGQQLTFQPASVSFPGVVTTASQTFAGDKTINDNLIVNGTIALPNTDATHGYLTVDGNPFLHSGNSNTGFPSVYLGQNAGSLTTTTTLQNAGVGWEALHAITTTQSSTAMGAKAFQNLSTGNNNTALGYSAGISLVSGDNNLYLGNNGNGVTTESNTVRIGNPFHTETKLYGIAPVGAAASKTVRVDPSTAILTAVDSPLSLAAVGSAPNAKGASIATDVLTLQPASASFPGVVSSTTQTFAGAKTFANDVTFSANIGLSNTSSSAIGTIGFGGVRQIHNYSSSATKSNIFVGPNAGNYTNSAAGNVAVGNLAGNAITTGNFNTFLGAGGGQFCATGSNNIHIANTGNAGDAAAIKIGTQGTQTTCLVAGIFGATSASGSNVLVNASGVLGTTTSSQKFKNSIETISPEKAAKLHDLRPVDFFYNEDVNKERPQCGLIAEEVLKHFPEFIVYDLDGNINTLQYHQLWPILLREVQIQKKRLDDQEQTILKLASCLKELMA